MKAANNQESGHAGQPGETTAEQAQRAPKAENDLAAEGITGLLKRGLEEAAAQESQENEVQPETEGQTHSPEEGAESNTAGAEENTEEAEGQQTEETEAQAEGSEGGLPPELQTAIEAWEEQGGGELPPVLQALVDRRINKLTSQRETEKSARETAEAKVQELTRELEEARAAAPAAASVEPMLDEKTLNERTAQFETFLADAENYLDGIATDEERGRIEKFMQSNRLDEVGLKRQVRQVNKALQQIPAERQRLAEYRKAEAAGKAEAKQYMPWLYDAKHPNYAKAEEVRKSIPNMRAMTPLHELAVGIYVLGLQRYEELKTAATKVVNGKRTNGVVKAPPKPPSAGAAAPRAARVNGNEAAEESVRQKFNAAPTRGNAVELIKLGLRG